MAFLNEKLNVRQNEESETMFVPESSISNEIKDLLSVCNSKKYVDEWGTARFNPPATKKEIVEWENTNSVLLPESYKEWLMFSNGSEFSSPFACFYTLSEICIGYSLHGFAFPDDLIVIGELIGDGERVCFSRKTGKISRYFEHKIKYEFDNFSYILSGITKMARDDDYADETVESLNMKLSQIKSEIKSKKGGNNNE